MIEGTNSSTLGLTEEEFQEYATGLIGLTSTKGVIDNLIERRKNVLAGGVNCIPFPFERFRTEIPGVEQGQYVLITANQKVGKSNLADFLYVFSVLDYCFEHPDQCSAHIIYFSLEESLQKVIERYMSYLLYKLDDIRIAPVDLRSTSKEYPVDEKILILLQSEKYQERLRFFEKCVQFETEDTNPTGILRVCERYAKSVGDYRSHKMESRGNSFKEVDVFDSYTPNDPNHYKIVVIDHIGLVDKEQGFKTKDAVDKMSEYFVKYLRNRYGFTCVAIQQQASEAEGLEAIKAKRMLPGTATLGDSKYTARDCDIAMGLFDPSKFGLSTWLGYPIAPSVNGYGLEKYARFMYVIANRNGEMGGICPLFFDGAVCHFEELPKPEETEKMASIFAKIIHIKKCRQQKRTVNLLTLIKRVFN